MNPDIFMIIYPLLGILAGLLAGMLGIGGGLVLVPAFIAVFHWQGLATGQLVHLAVGSSLGSIVITGIASTLAHHRRSAVEWPTALALAPGLVLGALAGAWLAKQMSTDSLRVFFAGFEILVALYMLSAIEVRQHTRVVSRWQQSLAGFSIGTLSGLVGIGGGTLTVPWMVWHGRNMRRAVATSAACGVPIGIAGSAGFVLAGTGSGYAGSSGFVYWPAVLGVGVFSMLAAPLGAHLAHTLPLPWLRRIFALLLLLTGLRLLY